jgi:hypothetical protein
MSYDATQGIDAARRGGPSLDEADDVSWKAFAPARTAGEASVPTVWQRHWRAEAGNGV